MKKSFTAKLLTVMRICAVQGVLALTICGVSIAHTHYAQVLDRPVTLNVSEVTFERALHEIESAANVKFAYSPDQLIEEQSVTLHAENKTLRAILDELLIPRKITYKVHEREASITLKKQNGDEDDQSLLKEIKIKPQPQFLIQITGTITEATSQQPMAGVNVIVKGTTNGTTTDSEGRYSIGADEGDILIFSFIGYASQEIRVTSQSVVDVVMMEDVKSLNEVVVNAGYYTTTKETQTGSIGKVEAADIQKQPVSNPLAALQARVPGLEVVQQTGVPGGNFRVRIRGQNSIANGNDPLFIIDGVPFTTSTMSFPETSGLIAGPGGTSPLNGINPSDIESIEVLKDADATAIYGSRGSNGVILINTKKGQAGKTKVNFNFYTGAANLTRKIDLLSTEQYLQMRREAFINDSEPMTVSNARDLLEWDTTRYTDWQQELLGNTAHTTDAQFTISGGEKSTQFSAGAGYHRETTVFPGDNSDQKLSVHSSVVNTSVNGKLKTNVSINYTTNKTDLLRQDLTDKALLLPPVAPEIYDQNGDLNWNNWSNTYENPLAYTKRSYEANTGTMIGNAVVGYKILSNLEMKSSMGYTNIRMDAITTSPVSSQFPDPLAQNSASFSNSSFNNWIVEPQLIWNPAIGDNRFSILVGTTFLDQTSEGMAQTGYGFSSEALMKNLSSAPVRTTGTNYYTQYRYHAVFGRLNYSLKEKYIVNITGRRDGSSRFGPGKQFSVFGAIGAAWIFSEEGFIKTALPFMSFGKLRTSYGTTGNDQLGDYQYLDTYSPSPGQYLGNIGLQPDRLSNPDFAWESNKKFEVALELGLFKNIVSSSFSFYRNRSSSQLVGYPLPATTGFNSIQGNFPALVQNTGVEIELNTRNIERNDFTWSTSFNISIPRNKLVEFPNLQAFPAYANTYVVGEPLNIRKLYNYTGIDPVTGLYTFEDVNDDGSYDFQDRQTVRFVGREFFGGLYNSLKYKGFQFDFLFQFVKQMGNDYILGFGPPGTSVNAPELVMDRWKTEGDNATVQRFTQSAEGITAYSTLLSSQHSVVDASFARLKNLSVSYSFPKSLIQKAYAENIRIFIQAQNLLTITGYSGLDPETQSNQLPPLRVITGGFQLTF